MKWIAIETHTHTVHSDAKLTVSELMQAAHAAELDAFVLSDHNTDAGMREVPANQAAPTVIPGIEWTTFHGHAVVIAPKRFVEWRDLTIKNFDAHLDAAHAADAVVVMSHPCIPGEPFCCGCHWDFEVPHWEKLDAMEVWHEQEPSVSRWNARAGALWVQKLQEGFRPTALSATDWHETYAPDVAFGVNYLEIDESLPLTDAVKDAIRHGRAYMTLGPTVALSASAGGKCAGIGTSLPAGDIRVTLRFDNHARQSVWKHYKLHPMRVAVIVNETETLLPFPGYGQEINWQGTIEKGYLRVELRGTMHAKNCALVLTNPIWVE